MQTCEEHSGRRFCLDEANAMLPLVRVIVSDLVQLARDVSERLERLTMLFAMRDEIEPRDPYLEELLAVCEELERDRCRLWEYADELIKLGVEPESVVEGLVDFPSELDGRPVALCWKLGESEISFWHEWDAGYAERRALTVINPTDAGVEETAAVV